MSNETVPWERLADLYRRGWCAEKVSLYEEGVEGWCWTNSDKPEEYTVIGSWDEPPPIPDELSGENKGEVVGHTLGPWRHHGERVTLADDPRAQSWLDEHPEDAGGAMSDTADRLYRETVGKAIEHGRRMDPGDGELVKHHAVLYVAGQIAESAPEKQNPSVFAALIPWYLIQALRDVLARDMAGEEQ